MSKFQSTLAEAAYVLAGHGFSTEFGDLSAGDNHWQALVDVSPVLLDNVGEHNLADDLRRSPSGWRACVVWIRQSQDGTVDVREAALSDYAVAQRVVENFEAAERRWAAAQDSKTV